MDEETGDDRQFSQASTLRDGTPVTIRVMRTDDRDRIARAFSELDRSTVYTRFFGYRKEIPASAFDRIAAIDFVNLAGLVVTVGAGSEEKVIGSASYVGSVASDGAKTAEVAFTIEEDYQRQGLAGKLLAALAHLARRHGIARLEAEVLAGNAPMLAVFQRSGLPMHTRRGDGVVHVTLDLVPHAGLQ